MRNKITFLFVLILSTFVIANAVAQETMSESTTMKVTSTHVETHPSQGDIRVIEGSTATLISSEAGIAVNMTTDELEENHVYSMWVVMINNPSACEEAPWVLCPPPQILGNTDELLAEITWGDSIVTGPDTRMEFSAFFPAGDIPKSWYGNGLTNPTDAHIHLIINDHGELIPEQASSMMNTYRGGCNDESLPPPFPDIAKADGEPGPNSCKLIQFVEFVQE